MNSIGAFNKFTPPLENIRDPLGAPIILKLGSLDSDSWATPQPSLTTFRLNLSMMNDSHLQQNRGAAYSAFIATNETGIELTQQELRTVPLAGNVFIGTSGFGFLDMVAIRLTESPREWTDTKNPTIVIIDVSKQMKIFWENAAQIIENAEDRISCIDKIRSELTNKAKQYFPSNWDRPSDFSSHVNANRTYQRLTSSLEKKQSWLSNNERFKAIQKIFQQKHFYFIYDDICNKSSKEEILNILSSNKNLKVDLFYTSNIATDYLNYRGQIKLLELIELLVPPKSLFVLAENDNLQQIVIQRTKRIEESANGRVQSVPFSKKKST